MLMMPMLPMSMMVRRIPMFMMMGVLRCARVMVVLRFGPAPPVSLRFVPVMRAMRPGFLRLLIHGSAGAIPHRYLGTGDA